jgi:hypothetical protein
MLNGCCKTTCSGDGGGGVGGGGYAWVLSGYAWMLGGYAWLIPCLQQTIKNILFVHGIPEDWNDDSFIDARYPNLIVIDDIMRDENVCSAAIYIIQWQ